MKLDIKWLGFFAIAFGVFASVTEQTSAQILVPKVTDHFGLSLPHAQWIMLAYILTVCALFMPLGKIADKIGRKPIFLTGLITLMLGGIIGSIATTYSVILIAKVIAGFGGASIEANGMAMIADIFGQKQRGKAMGLYMSIIGFSAIAGPLIGGYLTNIYNWRALFIFNVILCGLGIIIALIIFRNKELNIQPNQITGTFSFDWGGSFLSTATLLIFLLVITFGNQEGWTSLYISSGIFLCLLLFFLFIWQEKTTKDPLLDLDFFKIKTFSLSVTTRFLAFLSMSFSGFLMPFYLIQIMGFTTTTVGVLLAPGALSMAIIGPFSGQLSDKIGTKWLTAFGMAISGSALIFLAYLNINSSITAILLGLTLQGCGAGIFMSPNNSAIMNSIDSSHFGIGSGFMNLIRATASLSGIAIATTIVVITMTQLNFEPNLSNITDSSDNGIKLSFISGMKNSFTIAGFIMYVSAIISIIRGEPKSMNNS